MENIQSKITAVLENRKQCYIATTGKNFVDNCMVAYCSEGLTMYIGSFNDTLKCRNIDENPHVAICVDNIQIHGIAKQLKYGSEEYTQAFNIYTKKFPQYAFYFELKNNELYKIVPLVAWFYDSSKGAMHRDMVVFDEKYVAALSPYTAPQKFEKRT